MDLNCIFFVDAEAKNLIDLNHIVLSVEVAVYHDDGKTRAKPGEFEAVFSNNTLHILFSHAELYLNGKLISHCNNCYLHSAFVETELTTDTDSKASWAKCQGYNYLAKSNEKYQMFNKLAADFAQLKEYKMQLCGALHIDFLGCEKLYCPMSLYMFGSIARQVTQSSISKAPMTKKKHTKENSWPLSRRLPFL